MLFEVVCYFYDGDDDEVLASGSVTWLSPLYLLYGVQEDQRVHNPPKISAREGIIRVGVPGWAVGYEASLRDKGPDKEVKYACRSYLVNSDEYLKHALLQEIQILQQVKSKNIVAVYDVMESANNYYIIQELCDSDLEKYLKVTPHTNELKAL